MSFIPDKNKIDNRPEKNKAIIEKTKKRNLFCEKDKMQNKTIEAARKIQIEIFRFNTLNTKTDSAKLESEPIIFSSNILFEFKSTAKKDSTR